MNYENFKGRIALVKEATSITKKAKYVDFKIQQDQLYFTRVNTKRRWSIRLHELYLAYNALNQIDYKSIKEYVTGRVYSPSLAVLIASGLYDDQGIKNAKL